VTNVTRDRLSSASNTSVLLPQIHLCFYGRCPDRIKIHVRSPRGLFGRPRGNLSMHTRQYDTWGQQCPRRYWGKTMLSFSEMLGISGSSESLKYANTSTSTKTQTQDLRAHTHRIARKTLHCVSKGLQTQRLAIISWHFFSSRAP
jgi:hypothetical protein